MELFDLTIPIRAAGDQAVKQTFASLEASAKRTSANTAAAMGGVERAAERQVADLVTLAGAGRATAADLRLLQAAERQLQAVLTASNATIQARAAAAAQLTTVQNALAASTTRSTSAFQAFAARAGLGRLTGGAGALLGGLAGGIAATAGFQLITGSAQALRDAAASADEYESSLRKLNATSKLTGVAMDTVVELATRAEKEFLLSAEAAAAWTQNAIKMAARAGDASRAGEVLTSWLDLAAAQGLNAADALQTLQTTLIGQDEGLNRLGLANPQQLYEQWADAAGKSAAKMTEAEKALAILTAVQREAAKVQGEYARSTDTAAGRALRAGQASKSLGREIGFTLEPLRNAKNAAVEFVATNLAEFLRDSRNEFAAIVGPIAAFGSAFLEPIARLREFNREWTQALRAMAERELGPRAAQILLGGIGQHADFSGVTGDSNEDVRGRLVRDPKGTELPEITVEGRSQAEIAKAVQAREDALIDLARAGRVTQPEIAELTRTLALLDAQLVAGVADPEARRDAAERANAIRRLVGGVTPRPEVPMVSPPVAAVPGAANAGAPNVVQTDAAGLLKLEGWNDALEEQRQRAADILAGLRDTIAVGLAGAVAAAVGGSSVGEALATALGQGLQQLGMAAIEFGVAAIGLAKLVKTIQDTLFTNPVTAIIGGAALVAIGAALAKAGRRSNAIAGGRSVAGPALADTTTDITVTPRTQPATPGTLAGAQPPQPVIVHIGNLVALDPNDPAWQRNIAATAGNAVRRGYALAPAGA